MNYEKQVKVARQIREDYEDKGDNKVELLQKLDKKAKLPAEIFAYIFGIVGALVLGLGMCLAMKIIGDLMAVGIVIGCVGIAMVSVNYLIYKKIEAAGKKKYGAQILQLSDELLTK